jgi:hypothetical protein
MTSNLFLGKPSAMRLFLLLVAVLCLSTVGMAQDDTLDKTKDILVDEPADKVEDVFDPDTYDGDSDTYMRDVDRQKPSSSDACIVKERTETTCPGEAIQREKPLPNEACIAEQTVSGCPSETMTREKPSSESACERVANRCAAAGTAENPLRVELRELYDHPEEYYGKTVTVKAEIDDTFNENTFTVQDNGYENMVIKRGAACDKVQLLKDDEWKDGRPIEVTGVVEPFDRDKLECAYGPLDMERKEHDGFTKAPVLIVSETQTAQLTPVIVEEEAIVITPAEPEAAPSEAEAAPSEPEAEVAAALPQEEPIAAEPEKPTALPRTSSGLPLAGLAGLLSLLTAAGFGFYRR